MLNKIRCEKEHEMVMFKSTELAALQATIDELEEKLLKVRSAIFMRIFVVARFCRT